MTGLSSTLLLRRDAAPDTWFAETIHDGCFSSSTTRTVFTGAVCAICGEGTRALVLLDADAGACASPRAGAAALVFFGVDAVGCASRRAVAAARVFLGVDIEACAFCGAGVGVVLFSGAGAEAGASCAASGRRLRRIGLSSDTAITSCFIENGTGKSPAD